MSRQPNVLVIYTDQQSNWTLGCYGGDLIDTPHLDGLAREGALFSNYFVNSAVCTPSRGCLMTGRYPHFNGAFRNNEPLGRDEETIGHLLARHGYDTAYMGKWHLNGDPYPGWPTGPEESRGFQDSRYMFNRGHFKEVLTREGGEPPEVNEEIGDERTFMTDWLADRAVEYLCESHERSASTTQFVF